MTRRWEWRKWEAEAAVNHRTYGHKLLHVESSWRVTDWMEGTFKTEVGSLFLNIMAPELSMVDQKSCGEKVVSWNTCVTWNHL